MVRRARWPVGPLQDAWTSLQAAQPTYSYLAMALYEMTGDHALTPIPLSTFTSLGKLERQHPQRALRAHIEAITPGCRTMVLAEEFGDWVGANRRIDLLCLDDQARLVVVELKREEGGQMDLQALRYAAMVSTMRFDQAVEAHRKHLASIGASEDAEQSIRAFLGREEGPLALEETVRIVLAASDFSQELTTSVLWLNKQGLDIRCVQMRPHDLAGRVLVYILQVIPLPEAAQYQVAVREKAVEQAVVQAAARRSGRAFGHYDLKIGDSTFSDLSRNRLLYEVVSELLRNDVTPGQIASAVERPEEEVFMRATGHLDGGQFAKACPSAAHGFFADEADLLHIAGHTLALSKNWGAQVLVAVAAVTELMPRSVIVTYTPTSGIFEEVAYQGHTIRKHEDTTIEVLEGTRNVSPLMPYLREVAQDLGLSTLNGSGNPLNTRQLGARVINAIAMMEDAPTNGLPLPLGTSIPT